MNERVARVGNQLRDAFGKLRESWQNQEPRRKRLVLIIAIGVLVLAVGLTIVFRVSAGRYEVLYESMSRDEVTQAVAALNADGNVTARVNDAGQLEVPQNKRIQAIGILSQEGIPSTTLGYDIINAASGITTTESEKKQATVNQMQDRLQDIIKSFDGVRNAYVNLHVTEENNRVWSSSNTKNSGAVTVDMYGDASLTKKQVSGIRFLVASTAGIDPVEVTVVDGVGNTLAAPGEDTDKADPGEEFLLRQSFERSEEQRIIEKAEDIMSMFKLDPDDYRVIATARLDWDATIKEIVEYFPLADTNAGVVEHMDRHAKMSLGQFAEGVVGEMDNTDVPIYADADGDGGIDYVDYDDFYDYLVSYTKEQIERDGAKLESASVAVTMMANIDESVRQSIRDAVSVGTGVPLEEVSVQSFLEINPVEPEPEPTPTFLQEYFLYIAIAAGAALILMLVLVLLLRRRAKRKKLALAKALEEAEKEEAERIAMEIEMRKRELKNAAAGDQSDSAITNEVREFARANPEITATLLRNWLKEGE